MLSRTADNLYWVSRYIERAEFLARILDATARLATLPAAYGGAGNEWESALLDRRRGRGLRRSTTTRRTSATSCEFLAFSPDNPSSIRNCFELARSNARAVRTALTGEMWEAINGAYLELRRYDPQTMTREEFARFLEWVKSVSLVFDGSAYRTMLRNDAYWFSRLGVYIERADNTARILDVKYHVLLPETERVGGSLDYFQWSTILREVSALTAYHWVYRESLKPWLVADLLILNRQMPRSLAVVLREHRALPRRARAGLWPAGRRRSACRAASSARLENTRIEDIFQTRPARVHLGLHRRQQQARLGRHRAVSGLKAAARRLALDAAHRFAMRIRVSTRPSTTTRRRRSR